MENNIVLCDMPGIIIQGDNVVRTTKVKKWIAKNKPTDYKVVYLENPSSDFREVERGLLLLENSYKGISTEIKTKEVFSKDEPQYTYRLNVNTVLVGYTKEQLEQLKQWYNVND